MDETAFYCVIPYDLEHLGYGGVSFHWDGANRRWYTHFERSPDGPQSFTMTRDTVKGTRKAIAEKVRLMPKGGTVLVVQYAIDHEKDDAVGDRFCFTDVHMLPFDDGENFNRDHRRRNDWCPSSADLDWPTVERSDRFDRLDKYEESEGG